MIVHLKYNKEIFSVLKEESEIANWIVNGDTLFKIMDYKEVEKNKQKCFDRAVYCLYFFSNAQKLAEQKNINVISEYCEKRIKQLKDLRTVLIPSVCKTTIDDLLKEFGYVKSKNN